MINTPIIVLDCFIDDFEKEKLLLKNLDQFKKLNVPILLIANNPISLEIQKKINYLIFDKEDLLFNGDYFYDLLLYHSIEYKEFKFKSEFWYKQEHGLSVLCNLTKAMNFVKKLNFTKFIHFEWDYFIGDLDIAKIKEAITDFIENDKNLFLIKNNKEISFYFWMVDIDYWQAKFPQILKEEDYRNCLKTIKKDKLFQKVEDLFYIIFENHLYTKDCLNIDEFKSKFVTESKLNLSVSDFNFSKPNTAYMFKGFTKIYKNDKLANEIAILTINDKTEKLVETNYSIKINDEHNSFKHLTHKDCWCIHVINDFDKSKFPIQLKMNDEFEKTYHSFDEITNSIYCKYDFY
jgi:hypothetical protein